MAIARRGQRDLSHPVGGRIVRRVASGAILVAGAGALGSVVGGLLRKAGRRVTLLGRPGHLEAIAARGLTIEGLFGEHHVTGLECVTDAARAGGPYEAIFLTVKAYDTEATAHAVGPRLGPGGVLVSLQNGLGNLEACANAVGAERVLGGRVIFGAEVVEPGRVRVTVYADPVLLGGAQAGGGRSRDVAAAWAAALAAAGVPAEPTDAIAADLWAKVLYSAALNPIGALLGVSYGELAADPDSRALMDDVIQEVFAVSRAEDVPLPWPSAEAYRRVFYDRLVPSTAGHRSSMLQDIERGRRTEIDAINGHVVARGSRHGVPTPTNAVLTRLVHARERRAAEVRWSR
jgi:2-dehydropantoate 2-reductase